MLSGGVGSFNAGRRAVTHFGADEVVGLFADTRVEDEDTYRFLRESADALGIDLAQVADGRTPFEVFRDDRFLGNQRLANCSKYLKQKPAREWMDAHAGPEVTVVVGIDWSEEHRLGAVVAGWKPWRVWAPLCDRPLLDKAGMLANVRAAGLQPPLAYEHGLPHSNCLNQGCVRGGQAYWERLLRTRPEAYAYSEREEQSLREHLGKDVAMLRDRTGGKVRPMTLAEFRRRVESQPSLFDNEEWGGCGCFTEETA